MAGSLRQSDLNILLAVDGSEHSRAATQLLCDLPLSSESTITVMAVLLPRDASGHAVLEAALEGTRAMLAGKGVALRTELRTGHPAAELSEYADQHHPDLMVLGAKGLRATLGILLGGVVQQVIEYATRPVLTVRAPYTGLRRVMLVTDGSEYSQRAAEFLAGFPLPPATRVRVLHILPPLPGPVQIMHSWPMSMEAVSTLPTLETEKAIAWQAEQEEQAGQALLERTVRLLKDRGLEATSVLLRGDAATEIIEYTRAQQIDLIVAGSRGLSPMKRLMLGSLSRKLVHYAGCSVLIVKGGSYDR